MPNSFTKYVEIIWNILYRHFDNDAMLWHFILKLWLRRKCFAASLQELHNLLPEKPATLPRVTSHSFRNYIIYRICRMQQRPLLRHLQLGIVRSVSFAFSDFPPPTRRISHPSRQNHSFPGGQEPDGPNFPDQAALGPKRRTRKTCSSSGHPPDPRTGPDIAELHSLDSGCWPGHCLCDQHWSSENIALIMSNSVNAVSN